MLKPKTSKTRSPDQVYPEYLVLYERLQKGASPGSLVNPVDLVLGRCSKVRAPFSGGSTILWTCKELQAFNVSCDQDYTVLGSVREVGAAGV